MNEYQYNIQQTIDEKLIEYAKVKAKSLYHIEILYHHYIGEVSNIYRIPKEHYSKVLVIAYNKTLKELEK